MIQDDISLGDKEGIDKERTWIWGSHLLQCFISWVGDCSLCGHWLNCVLYFRKKRRKINYWTIGILEWKRTQNGWDVICCHVFSNGCSGKSLWASPSLTEDEKDWSMVPSVFPALAFYAEIRVLYFMSFLRLPFILSEAKLKGFQLFAMFRSDQSCSQILCLKAAEKNNPLLSIYTTIPLIILQIK